MSTEAKLIAVIGRMLDEPGNIQKIEVTDFEYYFNFQKYAFSIRRRSQPDDLGEYTFYVYPKWTGSTQKLAEIFIYEGGSEIKYSVFHSGKLSTSAAKLLEQLYTVVDSKATGVDEVFDAIIETPPF